MNVRAAPAGWEALRELAVSASGFIFDPRTGATFQVNATGRFILERLREGLSIPAVEKALEEAFEVGDEDLGRDVIEFLYLLRKHELLREDAP